jgi:hypothetical protein
VAPIVVSISEHVEGASAVLLGPLVAGLARDAEHPRERRPIHAMVGSHVATTLHSSTNLARCSRSVDTWRMPWLLALISDEDR